MASPVAGGDVHIKVGDRSFDFHGMPYVPYLFLRDGDLRVEAALRPCYGPTNPETTIHRLEFTLPAGSKLILDEAGLARVETPDGYRLDAWRDVPAEGSLRGHPHLNLFMLESPPSFEAAEGVLAKGEEDSDPEDFEVKA